jgi:PRC-barrel domain
MIGADEGPSLRWLTLISLLALLAIPALHAAPADRALVLAQQAAAPADAGKSADDAKDDDSLEAKYKRRFPQPTKVGHLIGLPVLDDNDVTLGHVQKVVRTPEGKIELIVSYSKWFGWFGRPVAVPIEAVVILALQLDSVEMQPEDYAEAPTWTEGKDQILADSDIVRVALGRR